MVLYLAGFVYLTSGISVRVFRVSHAQLSPKRAKRTTLSVALLRVPLIGKPFPHADCWFCNLGIRANRYLQDKEHKTSHLSTILPYSPSDSHKLTWTALCLSVPLWNLAGCRVETENHNSWRTGYRPINPHGLTFVEGPLNLGVTRRAQAQAPFKWKKWNERERKGNGCSSVIW